MHLTTHAQLGRYAYTIKIHDSELRGQQEAGLMQQKSELFTHSTALKL